MRKLFLIASMLISVWASAQTILTDDFESYTGFGTSIPGWTGGFKVYVGHGANNSKGLAFNCFNLKTSDFIQTPDITITSNAYLMFDARAAQYTGTIPTFAYTPVNGDLFEVYFVNGATRTRIDDISDSLPATISFKTLTYSLNNFVGQTGRVEFKCTRGANTNEFWFDIDNLKIQSPTGFQPVNRTNGFKQVTGEPTVQYAFEQPTKVIVWGINGEQVAHYTLNGSGQISLPTGGIWLLTAESNAHKQYFKCVTFKY